MKLEELNKLTENLTGSEQMPVLFIGHGSPMNAIEENEFVTGFRNIGKEIPKPKAISFITVICGFKSALTIEISRGVSIIERFCCRCRQQLLPHVRQKTAGAIISRAPAVPRWLPA